MKYISYELNAVREKYGHCQIIPNIDTQNELDEIKKKDKGIKYFWTIYGRTSEGIADAIADFTTKKGANSILHELNFSLKNIKKGKMEPKSKKELLYCIAELTDMLREAHIIDEDHEKDCSYCIALENASRILDNV